MYLGHTVVSTQVSTIGERTNCLSPVWSQDLTGLTNQNQDEINISTSDVTPSRTSCTITPTTPALEPLQVQMFSLLLSARSRHRRRTAGPLCKQCPAGSRCAAAKPTTTMKGSQPANKAEYLYW
jgi:hypothetical protein